MRHLLDEDNQVARHATVRGGIAFARHGQLHPVGYTCRDIDGDNIFGSDDAFAVAVVAFVLDDAPFAATVRTNALGLHLAQDGAAHLGDNACTMAMRAGFVVVVAGPRAAAGLAGNIFGHFNLFLAAFVYFFESKLHLDSQVCASRGGTMSALLSATESRESREVAAATEEVAKDAPELREDVVHAHSSALETAGAAIHSGKAKLVVTGLLVGVAQHVVGLGSLLELLLSLFVTRVAIRVVLQGQLAVGLLQLFWRGIFAHAQHFIVVSLSHNLYYYQ